MFSQLSCIPHLAIALYLAAISYTGLLNPQTNKFVDNGLVFQSYIVNGQCTRVSGDLKMIHEVDANVKANVKLVFLPGRYSML